MSAPTGVPMEVYMESLDHMDDLEEKVAQMMVQNEFLTNTLSGIADKLDLMMQAQNLDMPSLDKSTSPHLEQNNNRKHVKPSLPLDFNGDCIKGRAL